jgi:chemotaxis protein CheD
MIAAAGAAPAASLRRVHVVQGEFRVSAEPDLILTTILGSCVAACLHDAQAGVGGLNHFLLPGNEGGAENLRYGVHAMELLINGLLKAGARRSFLRARLFGGARMMDRLSDIGEQNARFARRFLQDEGIPLAGSDLGGTAARRLQFWPAFGRTRCIHVVPDEATLRRETTLATHLPPEPAAGAVELF